MKSRDFNNDLMKLFTRHGTDSMIFFGHAHIMDFRNSAAGGNFLDKMPRDCLRIIESKSKVRNSRNKPVVAKVSSSSSTPGISPDVAELKDMVKALLLDKKNQTQAPAPMKAVEESFVTCGGAHCYRSCPATDGNVYRDNIQEYVSQAAAANYNQGNTDSGTVPSNTITNPKVDLKGITTRSSVAYQGPTIPTTSSPPKVVEREPGVTKDTVPPTNNERTKDVQPPVHKSHAIIRVEKLSLSELIPTCMTLELTDRSITQLIGIAKDVNVKVEKFQFPTDFVVVDFDVDPRVPLILGRSFLKTGRALIDVYERELTLRVGKEAVTFNLDQTSKYSSNYDDMMANRIDVIEMACEEYSQEVLSFSDVIASGNPTPYYDPIVSTSSPTLTPFGDSDFLL
ncbi:reverse transcriptase domain-containing protein, partial [Tanacetum coccineum]